MPEEKPRKEKPRMADGWKDYMGVGELGTGVPVLRPWKPLNPPDTSAKYVGRDSVKGYAADEIAPLMNSKVHGVASLILALELGSPWPQTNANSLIPGSIELIIFGLFLSVIFAVIAVRSSRGIKTLRAMEARRGQE